MEEGVVLDAPYGVGGAVRGRVRVPGAVGVGEDVLGHVAEVRVDITLGVGPRWCVGVDA